MTRLYVALAVLDILALLVLVRMRRRWWLICALAAVAVAVNLALLSAVPDTSGRPKGGDMPQARMVACYVDEPVAVYFWLLDGPEPVAYRQPYSLDLHRLCQTAARALAQGVAVGIRRSSGARSRREGEPRGRYVPYVLPPAGRPKDP